MHAQPFRQLALAADAVQIADQQNAQQQLRINRWTTRLTVAVLQLLPHKLKTDVLVDQRQQLVFRNFVVQAEVVEKRLFSLLLNALLQIGLFAVVAVVFSRFVAKTRPRYQYSFYVAVLVFCLLAPAVNTFWHSTLTADAERSQRQASADAGGANRNLWSWTGHPKPYKQLIISHRYQRGILGLWVSLFLLRLVDFSRAVYRVHRLRRDASPVSLTDFGIANRIFGAKHRVTLLESAAIDDPVTVGLFCPTVLLPCRLLPGLGDEELSAILAHEYGHIRRRDFSVNFLCELISLPVAWHPGIRI
jgi:beta-lactamase regulating signal transducer with metallopeptidase domain